MGGLAALRILIIDDNAQMRTIIGTVLAAAGVRHLHYAQDGREGLAALARQEIDVAYVDYEMPKMNGLDLISAVRASGDGRRFLPIIMLTGHCDLIRLNAARDRGVTEFVAKPVTAKTILSRLESVIFRPRPFVQSAGFFGPDRRRRSAAGYEGLLRRSGDAGQILEL